MSGNEITAEIKDFIFQYIDSVEQMEILLLLSANPERFWTAKEIHVSLRSNVNSIEKRLAILHWYKIIYKENDSYCFKPEDPQLEKVIVDLAQVYRVHRYKILEMIFSPMKKCRDFAEAFVLSKTPKDPKEGDSNG